MARMHAQYSILIMVRASRSVHVNAAAPTNLFSWNDFLTFIRRSFLDTEGVISS